MAEASSKIGQAVQGLKLRSSRSRREKATPAAEAATFRFPAARAANRQNFRISMCRSWRQADLHTYRPPGPNSASA